MTMRFFDLHCDTHRRICGKRNETFDHCSRSLIWKTRKKWKQWPRYLAVWVPDGICGQGSCGFRRWLHQVYGRSSKRKLKTEERLQRDPQSLKRSSPGKNMGIYPPLKMGLLLGGKIENIDHFMSAGYQMMTLTWNGHNDLGSGVPGRRRT